MSTPWTGTPPVNRSRRWIPIAAAVVVVVAAVAGVGIWKLTNRKLGVDLSKLDVGDYPTQPRPLPDQATEDEGRYLAAFRLAEAIPYPYDVNPQMDYLYNSAMTDPATAATSLAANGTPVVQPVLEKYGMITGHVVNGTTTSQGELMRGVPGEALLIGLTSFPDADSAAQAADEMDAADFAVNPENQHVTIPGYPQAKAHFWLKSPSMAATMATGSYVTSVWTLSSTRPDLGYLTQSIQHTFDLQRELLPQLTPVKASELTSLPLDPDDILSRLLSPGDQPQVSNKFRSIGPRAALMCAEGQAVKDGLLSQAGVDRCAIGDGAHLLRARDDAAASALVPKLIDAQRQEDLDHEVSAPAGVSDARCFEQKKEVWSGAQADPDSRFACWVPYGRFVAELFSADQTDAQQRTAAQYAILVNSA